MTDSLLPNVYAALSGDSELVSLTTDIGQFRQPEDPKLLSGKLPAVVFRPSDGPDERGLHGAAINPEVEASVWGYKSEAYDDCVKAAQRISEVFLGGIPHSTGSGSLRWGEILGWQQIDQPDPDTVLLRATFRTRYWSAGRITAVAG